MPFPHPDVSSLETERKARRVEQGRHVAVARKLRADRRESLWLACEHERRALVVGERFGHQFRKIDRVQETRCNTRWKRIAGACEQRQSDPERVARRRMRVVRPGIQK